MSWRGAKLGDLVGPLGPMEKGVTIFYAGLVLGLILACLGSGCGDDNVPPLDAGDARWVGTPPEPTRGTATDGAAWEAYPVEVADGLQPCGVPWPPASVEIAACVADPALAVCIVRNDTGVHFIGGCAPVPGKSCVEACPLVDGGAL